MLPAFACNSARSPSCRCANLCACLLLAGLGFDPVSGVFPPLPRLTRRSSQCGYWLQMRTKKGRAALVQAVECIHMVDSVRTACGLPVGWQGVHGECTRGDQRAVRRGGPWEPPQSCCAELPPPLSPAGTRQRRGLLRAVRSLPPQVACCPWQVRAPHQPRPIEQQAAGAAHRRRCS